MDSLNLCDGSGEIVMAALRDRDGNYDTVEYDCPGCPACVDRPANQDDYDFDLWLLLESEADLDAMRAEATLVHLPDDAAPYVTPVPAGMLDPEDYFDEFPEDRVSMSLEDLINDA